MALELALVIKGDNEGARTALNDTAEGIKKLGTSAETASTPVKEISDTLAEAAAEAPKAADGFTLIGTAADGAAPKVSTFKSVAAGAFVGLAAGIATAGIAAALGAMTEAFIGFVAEITSSQPRIEHDLKAQADLIRQIKGAYAEAEGAAASYGNNSTTLLAFQQQQSIAKLTDDLGAETGTLLSGGLFGANALQPGLGPEDSPLNTLVTSFRADLRAGTADVIAFRNEVAALASQEPLGSSTRTFAEAILADTEQAAKLQEELQRAIDLYKGLTGDSEAAATALGGTAEKLTLNGEAAEAALPALREYAALLAAISGSGDGIATITTSTTATPGAIGGSFADGGYTGDLPPRVAAGIVHGQEFVVNAAATAKHRPLLEAINSGIRGYASGGYVGSGGSTGTAAGGFTLFGELSRDFNVLRGSVSDLVNQLRTAKTPLEALGAVVDNVSDRFLTFAANALDTAVFGSSGDGSSGWLGTLIEGLFGSVTAGTGHTGAIIGAAATSRSVPASLFVGAPRHHTGTQSLSAGETPFIGMVGEEIGWPQDLARKYGGSTNVFNIETADVKSFAQSKSMTMRGAARALRQAKRYT